ncbi:MAG: LLM class flavin-dependent oxidoreductase [Candidatus Binatia bacterium]|nr:LLM class flavin-dependent oxidoreductase [Candidatus Binatia bacterium]
MSRLGIVLYHGIDNGAELAQYGRLAEEAGFESLWVTERYFHEETFSLLGFLAAATQRLKLGVGVVNPYTRNPALVAMASATLDRLSGGRFLLGLGRSEKSVIQDKLGIPYGKARATLEETVVTIRRLLAGERVTSSSGHFRLNGARLALLPMQPRLPIYLAAIGTKGLRLAGAMADGVLLNAYVPPAYVGYAVTEVRQAATAAGRDAGAIDIACMLVVRLTDDPVSIRPSLKQRLVRLLDEPHVGEILLDKGGFDPGLLGPLRATIRQDGEQAATRFISDDMVEAFYVVGPAAHCQERIAAYRQAGVTLPLLLPRLEDFRRVAAALHP